MKENCHLTYDQAMARVEEIVRQLEQAEAISMAEYERLATEAKQLLDYCSKQINKLSEEEH